MVLDMSTFAGVEAFANQVKKEVKEINYVCLNAGTLQVAFKLGEEGYEETIQINVLSTALLAILLLPWMKVAGKGKAHLGFVTSGLHKGMLLVLSSYQPKYQNKRSILRAREGDQLIRIRASSPRKLKEVP